LLPSSLKYSVLPFAIQNYNFACNLHHYDSWFLTLKEDNKVRVLGNGVLRTVLVPNKYEVTEDWRKVHGKGAS
jgi:hypothetical protein